MQQRDGGGDDGTWEITKELAVLSWPDCTMCTSSRVLEPWTTTAVAISAAASDLLCSQATHTDPHADYINPIDLCNKLNQVRAIRYLPVIITRREY